jgi:hypothetical protein
MFWNLVLAHLIGDFLFQSDWMANNRDKIWVLSIHGGIHLGLLILLSGLSKSIPWLMIIVLALIHISQDAIKVNLIRKLPDWTATAFVLDQILHLGLIWLFSWFIQDGVGNPILKPHPAWVMYGITFLFVTYVWFVSERVLFRSDPDYLVELFSSKYSRMVARVGLVSLLLLGKSLMLPASAIVLSNPYSKTKYPQRAFLTDIGISIIGFLFLIWLL